MIDGGAASDVMACLGFGRMSSFIRQINTSLREFEREPGHERRIEKKIKNKQTFFYAGWLEGGNEGGKKVCSACSVPSQAAALMAPWPGAFKLLVPVIRLAWVMPQGLSWVTAQSSGCWR